MDTTKVLLKQITNLSLRKKNETFFSFFPDADINHAFSSTTLKHFSVV